MDDNAIINVMSFAIERADFMKQQREAGLDPLRAMTLFAGRVQGEREEARADCARFEAALDAANKELAQARAERDEYQHLYTVSELDRIKAVEKAERMQDNAMFFAQRYDEYSLVAKDTIDRSRATIAALVVACRAMWRTIVGVAIVERMLAGKTLLPVYVEEIRHGVEDQKSKQAKQAGE